MRILFSVVVLVLVALFSATVVVAEQPSYDIALSELLDEEGYVVLPEDFSGSVDISGYALASGPGQAPRFIRSGSADEAWSRDEFGVPGCDDDVQAMAVMAGELYIGGEFSACGFAVANHIVRFTPATGEFSGLGSGVDDDVLALAVMGTDLYVGGDFTEAGGVAANSIAAYDTTATGDAGWSVLGNGVTGFNGFNGFSVRALAVMGTDLYVGGDFTEAGGSTASRIAVYDTTQPGDAGWSALGSGVNSAGVNALAVIGTDLYVGGRFTEAGGMAVSRIALYDTTQPGDAGWSSLGSGVDDDVFALAVIGTDLYVGGDFTQAGGSTASRIAVFDTTVTTDAGWSTLGNGVTGFSFTVRALAVMGTNLYVGGRFTQAGAVVASDIAVYDTTAIGDAGWLALGSGVNDLVFTLAVIGTDLYVGGDFSRAGGVAANSIAAYDTTETGDAGWSALGSGVNERVFALAAIGTDLYVGGFFSLAGGNVVNNIAVYDTTQSGDAGWSALGSGETGSIFALAVMGTNLYVGGRFTQAGGVAANGIAVYDTTATGDAGWSALGSGVMSMADTVVTALAVIGTDLYVGGRFTQAGGVAANGIAVYDTMATGDAGWSTLGSGVTSMFGSSVSALAVIGTDLYVGGFFTQAGASQANSIAVYDTNEIGDASWSALGNGVTGNVRALAVMGTDLYVGGDFPQAGSVTANNIAAYDTTAIGDAGWSALGSGVNNIVESLAVMGTDLYVGGEFTQAGGSTASRIAVYDTTQPGDAGWSALGSGVNSAGVNALAVIGMDLYVGGSFTQAGGVVNGRFARYQIPTTHTVGGSVSGLAGTGLVLQNNGGDDLVIIGNGPFTFTTVIDDRSSYSVAVSTQPSGPNQTCSVSNGMGKISGADVTDVQITCVTDTFTVGGSVSGLTSTGLVLRNNGGDDLVITGDGPFAFATALDDGSTYNATVSIQPTGPSQTCSVTNGSGTLSGANVTDVQITCVTDTFSIGGTVAGLSGSGLVLQNNGGDDLAIAADGPFTFATPLDDGSSYAVTVLSQPLTVRDQQCTVSNGSGTLAGGDVIDVAVHCEDILIDVSIPDLDLGLVLIGAQGSATITLTNTGQPDLIISAIGSPSVPFAIVGGDCLSLPLTLSAGQSCQIDIMFSPTAAGTFSDSIQITSNATSSPDTVRLTGTAIFEPLIIPTLNTTALLVLTLLLSVIGVAASRGFSRE